MPAFEALKSLVTCGIWLCAEFYGTVCWAHDSLNYTYHWSAGTWVKIPTAWETFEGSPTTKLGKFLAAAAVYFLFLDFVFFRYVRRPGETSVIARLLRAAHFALYVLCCAIITIVEVLMLFLAALAEWASRSRAWIFFLIGHGLNDRATAEPSLSTSRTASDRSQPRPQDPELIFDLGNSFYAALLVVLGLSTVGAVQLVCYAIQGLKTLRLVFRNRMPTRFIEPDGEPQVAHTGDLGEQALERNLTDQADGSLQLEVVPPPAPDRAQLRRRTQNGKKFVGVTEVNAIKGPNGRIRLAEKKVHSHAGCHNLTQSQSPLAAILEIDFTEAGLCRHCH